MINIFNVNISILDILCILAIVLAGYFGYKKGFARSVVGLMSFGVSVAAAYILRPIIYDILMGSAFSNSVYSRVATAMAANTPSFNDAPSAVSGLVSNAASETMSAASVAVSGALMYILSFLLVFVIVRIIVRIGSGLLINMAKLPVIGSADKLLGLAAGVIKWGVLAYALLVILAVLVIPDPDSFLGAAVKSSVFCGYIQKGELINRLFGVL